ncbi:MAG: outer membrane beta-barrel protein [Ferrimonas sp.]
METLKNRVGLFFCLIFLAFLLNANEFSPAPINLINGVQFVPDLDVGLGYNDNTARSNSDKTHSWFSQVTPSFYLQHQRERSRVKLTYRLENGKYFRSKDDDYTDHLIDFNLLYHLTRRHRIETYYNYLRGHEARGTGILQAGFILDDDKVAKTDIHHAAFIYGYGAKTARINAEFEIGNYEKEYRNYLAISRFRNNETTNIRFSLFWRLAPKTQLLTEWHGFDTDYRFLEATEVTRDSRNQRIFAGIQWNATAKTSGLIKLGYENRNFNADSRQDFNGFAWKANVVWRPRTYSTIEFETGSRAKDPDTFGDYIREDRYYLNWRHEWKKRFSTTISFDYLDERYTGIDRNDQLFETTIGVVINWRRWFSTELSYQYINQDSNFEIDRYDQNVLLASVRIAL